MSHTGDCDSIDLALLRMHYKELYTRYATPQRLGTFAAARGVPADKLDMGAHSKRWRDQFAIGYNQGLT